MSETLALTKMSAGPRTQVVGTALTIVAGSALMAGLLGFYISRRHLTEAPGSNWIPDDVTIPNAQMVMAVVTVMLASIVGHWALWSSRRNQRGHTYLAIGLMLLLGVLYLNMLMFSLNRMNIVLGAGEWQNLAFSVTGVVVAMSVMSLIYTAMMGLRSLGGDLGPDATAPLSSAVLIWDFVAVAFVAAWYVVYVVK